jgi:hemolysin activation/secretion protein
VVRLFQDYLQRWGSHALAFRSTFSVGINALGATAQTSKQSADSEFFAWLGQGQYAYRLDTQGSQLVLRGALQLSNEPLLPLERVAVGGVNTVRGYRENTLVRDQGYSLSAEFHYPLLGGGDSRSNYSLNLIPFFDWGQGWNHYDSNGTETLYSVGIGLNGRYKQLNTDFYYGHALKRPSFRTANDLQDDGIHFQLRVDVF